MRTNRLGCFYGFCFLQRSSPGSHVLQRIIPTLALTLSERASSYFLLASNPLHPDGRSFPSGEDLWDVTPYNIYAREGCDGNTHTHDGTLPHKETSPHKKRHLTRNITSQETSPHKKHHLTRNVTSQETSHHKKRHITRNITSQETSHHKKRHLTRSFASRRVITRAIAYSITCSIARSTACYIALLLLLFLPLCLGVFLHVDHFVFLVDDFETEH